MSVSVLSLSGCRGLAKPTCAFSDDEQALDRQTNEEATTHT